MEGFEMYKVLNVGKNCWEDVEFKTLTESMDWVARNFEEDEWGYMVIEDEDGASYNIYGELIDC